MTLSRPGDRTCSIRVDSATTDDEGEFSCLLGDAVSEADIETMAVEVEEPGELAMVKREKAELEREIADLRARNIQLESALSVADKMGKQALLKSSDRPNPISA